MTDLHSHIIPGVDDGAQTIDDSLAIIEAERKDGVEQIALTSHYDPECESIDHFLNRRDQGFEKLISALQRTPEDPPRLKRGAEVLFSPRLGEMDTEKLCLEGTHLLLMEFPELRRPYYLNETIYSLQTMGIIPLIAHVERYSFVMRDPSILYDWIAAGAYAQVNAGTLIRSRRDSIIWRLISDNLVQIIASDTHSVEHRPPNLRSGYTCLRKRLGNEIAERVAENAAIMFNGGEPDTGSFYLPKKVFGFWR